MITIREHKYGSSLPPRPLSSKRLRPALLDLATPTPELGAFARHACQHYSRPCSTEMRARSASCFLNPSNYNAIHSSLVPLLLLVLFLVPRSAAVNVLANSACRSSPRTMLPVNRAAVMNSWRMPLCLLLLTVTKPCVKH